MQQPQNTTTVDDETNQAMLQHILDFKKRMEYYRNNPGLKSSGSLYTADSAVLEMESLLNFNFCYTGIECNKKTFVTSEVVMPLDSLAKINDPNLMQVYYDKVIDTIQAQMSRANYDSTKLLLVDLKQTGTDVSGNAIVSVKSLIGNKGANSVQYTDGWIYGENEGLCGSHALSPEDAATQLDARVTSAMIPDPPSGCRWYFVNLYSTYIIPTQDRLNNPLDNYRDYKIYYATDDVTPHITDPTKCLSNSDMNFYEGYYIDYAQSFETETGKDFTECIISGNPYYMPYRIQHDYYIFTGNRLLACTIDIDDIYNY